MLDAFCYTGGFGFACRQGRRHRGARRGRVGTCPGAGQRQRQAQRPGQPQIHRAKTYSISWIRWLMPVKSSAWWCWTRPNSPGRATPSRKRCAATGGLQSQALKLLDPDGILVVCCCSGLIDMAMLQDLLAQLAVEERREIQILEVHGQAADHPVAVTCMESDYLKCIICRV